MSEVKFFFDTADVDSIKCIWEKISTALPASGVLGVTTNPNALDKAKIFDLKSLEKRVGELCALISEIRGSSDGEVYVQVPNSRMSTTEYLEFAKYISQLGDGVTKVAIKIPPYRSALELSPELSQFVRINVTGVSDCAQALRSFSYGVDYVSVIPGRMEEIGLDAKAHLSFVQDRKQSSAGLIAGSMRSIEQLNWACKMNCIPTVGSRVWDLISNESAEHIKELFLRDCSAMLRQDFPPLVSAKNIELAQAFFEQMDGFGLCIAEEFRSR